MRKSIGLVVAFAALVCVAASLAPAPAVAQWEWDNCRCHESCEMGLWWCQDMCAAFGPPAPYCLAQCSSQFTNCSSHCGSMETC